MNKQQLDFLIDLVNRERAKMIGPGHIASQQPPAAVTAFLDPLLVDLQAMSNGYGDASTQPVEVVDTKKPRRVMSAEQRTRAIAVLDGYKKLREVPVISLDAAVDLIIARASGVSRDTIISNNQGIPPEHIKAFFAGSGGLIKVARSKPNEAQKKAYIMHSLRNGKSKMVKLPVDVQ